MKISIKRKPNKKPKKIILDLKTTITDMKNSLEGFKSKSEWAEKRISELKAIEIIKSEEKKEKRLQNSKQSLTDLGTPSRRTTYAPHTGEVPEGERQKGAERIEEIMAENYPNVMEDKNINIQEVKGLQVT